VSTQAPAAQDQEKIAAAIDHVYQTVHLPQFFAKLAQAYNIAPQTDEEAQQLLDIAEQQRQRAYAKQAAQLRDQNSLIAKTAQLCTGQADSYDQLDAYARQAAQQLITSDQNLRAAAQYLAAAR
jgi:hypothetical protein